MAFRGLVLPDGVQGPAVAGVDQGGDHCRGRHRHPPGPPEVGVGIEPFEAQGTIGHALEVVGQDPHHLAEAQGDDGQVIPPDPEDRKPGDQSEGDGHQPPGQQGGGKRQACLAQRPVQGGDQEVQGLFRRGHGQERRGVGPQSDEGIGPQMQLAANPVDQVVGHRQGDEDGHVVQQPHLIFVGPVLRPQEKQKQQDQGGQG
jgi:hypothetical protein